MLTSKLVPDYSIAKILARVALLIGFVSACSTAMFLHGQEKKPAKKVQSAKPLVAKKKVRDTSYDEPVLGPTPATAPGQEGVIPDQTETGRQKYEDAKNQARGIFASRDAVLKQLAPLIPPRDSKIVENQRLSLRMSQLQNELARLEDEFKRLKGLAGQKGQNVNGALTEVKRTGDAKQGELNACRSEFAQRADEIGKLNQQIAEHSQELIKQWQNLNVIRKSWLEVRQPQRRYALGEYEDLKEMTAEWLAIDNLWPELYSWAALGEYELGNYILAEAYLIEAQRARDFLAMPKAWPQGDALAGLIRAKNDEKRGTAAKDLQSAVNATKSKTDWQIHFLIGRASFDNPRKAVQARNAFEKSLKVNPNLDWVKFWNARLQTTSENAAVQNFGEGTKTLEALWERSPKKSWRLANALVQAYDSVNQKAAADAAWAKVLELAPQPLHQKLADERVNVVELRRKAAEEAAKTKK